MVLPSFSFPAALTQLVAGPDEAKNHSGKKCPPPGSDPFNDAEFGKISPARQEKTAVVPNRRFKVQKRSQLFIRVHNETLPVVAVCVSNEDRSPVGINRRDTAPTPTSFAQIVSDDFPVLDASSSGDAVNALQSEHRMGFHCRLELAGNVQDF
jgi:hypothetical protein